MPKRTGGSVPGQHLDEATLADLVDGRLDPRRRAAVTGHIESCRQCRQLAAELRGIVGALPARRLESPPAWLAAWADEAIESLRPRPRRPARFRLALAFDSWAGAALGARGVPAGSRRLQFNDGSADLDLELELGPGGRIVTITGQVLDASRPGDAPFEAGIVRLMSSGRTMARADLGPRGEFRLAGVPRRVYRLTVTARGFRADVDSLEV